MKIEFKDDKIIVYLFRYTLNVDDLKKLNNDVKNLFIKLIKVYKLEFFGYSKVHIYHNKKYGNILEIEKIYNSDFNQDIIDLKLIIHEDVDFYMEFDDMYFNNSNYSNGKYYLNMDKIDNLYKYLEFGKIIYCSKYD